MITAARACWPATRIVLSVGLGAMLGLIPGLGLAQSSIKVVPNSTPTPNSAPEPEEPETSPETTEAARVPERSPAAGVAPSEPPVAPAQNPVLPLGPVPSSSPPPSTAPGLEPGASPEPARVRPWPWVTLAASSVAMVAGTVLLVGAAQQVSDKDNFEIQVDANGQVEVTDRFVQTQQSVVVNGLTGTLLLSSGIAGSLTSIMLITR